MCLSVLATHKWVYIFLTINWSYSSSSLSWFWMYYVFFVSFPAVFTYYWHLKLWFPFCISDYRVSRGWGYYFFLWGIPWILQDFPHLCFMFPIKYFSFIYTLFLFSDISGGTIQKGCGIILFLRLSHNLWSIRLFLKLLNLIVDWN